MASLDAASLRCGVIGAGIAGLAAAIALRRVGHDVEIFERSTFKNEIGAAITFTPNGNVILDHWGFDAKGAAETDKEQSRIVDSQTLEVESLVAFDDVRDKYGHNFNAFHRVDLHNELRKMALALGSEIGLGKEVVELDCKEGIVTLKDGSKSKKDLIVVADGIKSSFVSTISGVDAPVNKVGKSIFRGLIPMERLRQDSTVWPAFKDQPSGFYSALHQTGSGVMFITYPCRSDEVMNVAVFHTTRPGHEDDEGWNSPATTAEVLSVLDGMHPFFPAMVQHADEMKCFPVVMRDVIPRYHNGKAILIGDAAHPMQPTHAQGAAMSLEDAAALEILFKNWDSAKDKVERRTKLFNDFRLPRGNTTALVSNGMFYNESMDAYVERIRRFYSGPLLPLKVEPWSTPHQEFFYRYNVFKQAEKAMTYKDADDLPEDAITHFYS